jgi:hypothetical protein
MNVTFSNLGRYGEFGNQLFEIAATYAYGLRTGRKAMFPKWRCYVSGIEYSQYFESKIIERDNIKYDIQHTEPSFTFSPIPDFTETTIDLKGYFQTEKYFKNYKKEIINLFQPSGQIIDRVKNIDCKNSISLQLRFYDRGAVDPSQQYYSSNENIDFLKQAIHYFGKHKTYIVTTNNTTKAKKMFGVYNNFIFLNDYNLTNIEEFFVQTRCEHNIITNSSFGWWGAYLNENPDKVVFAPTKWFKIVDTWHNSSDIILKEWKTL